MRIGLSHGSCSNVCPVKINIHEQIYAWRQSSSKGTTRPSPSGPQ
jgi:L-lactate utilization protein LutB